MDAQVLQAMARWPNVPACHGWLGLDARGHWYLRDEAAQAQGGFPASKGDRIRHEALLAFIRRNYAADAQGRWFFQNGPQRVFVSLEAAPLVLSEDGAGGWRTHTGRPAAVQACWLDEAGRLFVLSDAGFALVAGADMLAAARALEAGQWPEPTEMAFAEMPGRFGYVLAPQADALPVP